MTNKLLDNQGFISIAEAHQSVPYTFKEIRNWCQRYRQQGLAFKHANKWYLNQEAFISYISEQQ